MYLFFIFLYLLNMFIQDFGIKKLLVYIIFIFFQDNITYSNYSNISINFIITIYLVYLCHWFLEYIFDAQMVSFLSKDRSFPSMSLALPPLLQCPWPWCKTAMSLVQGSTPLIGKVWIKQVSTYLYVIKDFMSLALTAIYTVSIHAIPDPSGVFSAGVQLPL